MLFNTLLSYGKLHSYSYIQGIAVAPAYVPLAAAAVVEFADFVSSAVAECSRASSAFQLAYARPGLPPARLKGQVTLVHASPIIVCAIIN